MKSPASRRAFFVRLRLIIRAIFEDATCSLTENPAQAPGFPVQSAWSATKHLVLDGFLHRVLEAADGVLHLAGDLLRLAFGFELGVPGGLARDFLHFAFGLLDAALNAIFVHVDVLMLSGAVTAASTLEHRPAFHANRYARRA